MIVDAGVDQLGKNTTVAFTTPRLRPVYPGANNVTLHVWIPDTTINLTVSDTELERVDMWKSATCGSDEPGRFQTARLMAVATFRSGEDNFTANILPIVAHRVSLCMIYYTHTI